MKEKTSLIKELRLLLGNEAREQELEVVDWIKRVGSGVVSSAKAVGKDLKDLLASTEDKEYGKTFYIKMDLGIGRIYELDGVRKSLPEDVPKTTAIFIPKRFDPEKQTWIIIYLHGHTHGGRPRAGASIQEYLNAKPTGQSEYTIREKIAASGGNVIFIAPTLGPTSSYGTLVSRFDDFMNICRSQIDRILVRDFKGKKLNLCRLVLAAHSGGGKAMGEIIKAGKKSNPTWFDHIEECWGFDSLYNSDLVDIWRNWGKKYGRKYHNYYRDDAPMLHSDKKHLTRPTPVPSITSERSAVRHGYVVTWYILDRINALPLCTESARDPI